MLKSAPPITYGETEGGSAAVVPSSSNMPRKAGGFFVKTVTVTTNTKNQPAASVSFVTEDSIKRDDTTTTTSAAVAEDNNIDVFLERTIAFRSSGSFRPPLSLSVSAPPKSMAVTTEPTQQKQMPIGYSDVKARIQQSFLGSLFTFPTDIPIFEPSEIIVGKLLGCGGFSNVFEIPHIKLNENIATPASNRSFAMAGKKRNSDDRTGEVSTSATETDASETSPKHFDKLSTGHYGNSRTMRFSDYECRRFIAQHCKRTCTGDARYAIKRLRDDHEQSEELLCIGMADLIIETRFLYHLEHPNVIKLRGIAATDPYSKGNFLVLDRLYDTLEKRLEGQWAKENLRNKSVWGRFLRPGKRQEFLEDRLNAAFDLSSAIAYIHSKHIVHRDIKPENIGFDLVSIAVLDVSVSGFVRGATWERCRTNVVLSFLWCRIREVILRSSILAWQETCLL
jgi:Protein kinase domain